MLPLVNIITWPDLPDTRLTRDDGKKKIKLNQLKVRYHPIRQPPINHILSMFSILSVIWISLFNFFCTKVDRKRPRKWLIFFLLGTQSITEDKEKEQEKDTKLWIWRGSKLYLDKNGSASSNKTLGFNGHWSNLMAIWSNCSIVKSLTNTSGLYESLPRRISAPGPNVLPNTYEFFFVYI